MRRFLPIATGKRAPSTDFPQLFVLVWMIVPSWRAECPRGASAVFSRLARALLDIERGRWPPSAAPGALRSPPPHPVDHLREPRPPRLGQRRLEPVRPGALRGQVAVAPHLGRQLALGPAE